LTATGNRKVQAGFEPLVQGFIRVPYNDLGAISKVAANSQDVAAILVEPIQGEGGINIPDAGYLDGIRAICDDNNWLMMLDEIQTGMGRTGRWFAWQHSNARPDVATLAKALGNGVPVGACLARCRAADMMQPGSHGTTFGGNPLACRAAIAVLESLEQEQCVANAARLGEQMLAGFSSALAGLDGVIDIRGRGLMIGIELDRPCSELVSKAVEQGLLINVTAERVIRLLPPLILTDKQADIIVEQVSNLIHEFIGQ
jgi:acetylornithine aminotransferase